MLYKLPSFILNTVTTRTISYGGITFACDHLINLIATGITSKTSHLNDGLDITDPDDNALNRN